MGARRATTAGVYGRVQTGIHGAYDAMQVLPTQRTCMCRVRRYLRGPHEAMPTVRSERAMPEMFRARKNSYRARKIAAEIAGPVPPEVYRKLLAEGPCVYCGAPADHIDHVRPLHRGGWEHESNLVPACGRCNSSKGHRLLTEWNTKRVEYGRLHSPKVAAELERLTAP
jgi:5-methylcytosine-specific restriction endonuclease McrA